MSDPNQPINIDAAIAAESPAISADLLRTIVELVDDSCLIVDENGAIVYANPSAEELFRRKAQFLVAKTLESLIPSEVLDAPLDTNEAQDPVADVSEGETAKRPVKKSEFNLRLAGEDRRIEIARHRQSNHTVIVMRDLSPSREAEDRVRRSELKLNEMESTMALSQELLRNNNIELNRSLDKLQQLNFQLAESTRSKNEFLSNTSHELRTPMNAIIGFLQIINDGLCENDEERDAYIQNALNSARHLLNLINDVLDSAKIESGKIGLTIQEIEVGDLFDEVYDMLGLQAQQSGLELKFETDEKECPIVLADPHRLRQVLINLAGNAIKFTPEGHVLVSVAPYPDDPDTLLFSVEDTGIGIPEEYHTRVFEKFVQVDGSSTREHRGTGLGLCISKSLVELMGGQMWILKSAKDKGTTFSFTLPAGGRTKEVAREESDMDDLKELLPESF